MKHIKNNKTHTKMPFPACRKENHTVSCRQRGLRDLEGRSRGEKESRRVVVKPMDIPDVELTSTTKNGKWLTMVTLTLV